MKIECSLIFDTLCRTYRQILWHLELRSEPKYFYSETALPLPSDVLIKTQHKLEEKLKNGPANYNKVESNNCIFHENISFIMKVYPGIILANGDTIKDFALVKKLRVSHILNAAEGHVRLHNIKENFWLWLEPKVSRSCLCMCGVRLSVVICSRVLDGSWGF